MHIITRKRLNEFAQKHPNIKVSLEHWYKLIKRGNFRYAESEYQQLVTLLDDLIDVVGENENHPLASLMEVIGVLIEKYEDEHVPELTEI